jgi:hypothetical protein
MKYQKYSLHHKAWFGDQEITIRFPEHWHVDIFGGK